MPQTAVTLDVRGEKRRYEGPLPLDVSAKAGGPASKEIHGAELARVVIVTAKHAPRRPLAIVA